MISAKVPDSSMIRVFMFTHETEHRRDRNGEEGFLC